MDVSSWLWLSVAAGAVAVLYGIVSMLSILKLPAGNARTLWQLAAAVFEGQALKLLGSDAYTKRLGSKLLHELRVIGQGDQADPARERLAQDLLFFCAQCHASQGAGPRLAAVHEAYRLTEDHAGDYEDASLGRIDPAWVAQAKRRVLAAKESWSSAAEGDQHRGGHGAGRKPRRHAAGARCRRRSCRSHRSPAPPDR